MAYFIFTYVLDVILFSFIVTDAMQSLCKNNFLMNLYRKIDGAVLWSQNERNLDCVITFQTHSILQRFMLRFDFLQLDCNDHLYIYDGAHAVGTYKVSNLFNYYIFDKKKTLDLNRTNERIIRDNNLFDSEHYTKCVIGLSRNRKR